MPKSAQILLFSATLPNEILELISLHENDSGFTEGIFAPWAFYKDDFTSEVIVEVLGEEYKVRDSLEEIKYILGIAR